MTRLLRSFSFVDRLITGRMHFFVVSFLVNSLFSVTVDFQKSGVDFADFALLNERLCEQNQSPSYPHSPHSPESNQGSVHGFKHLIHFGSLSIPINALQLHPFGIPQSVLSLHSAHIQ